MGRRGGPDYVQQRPTQDTVALIDCGIVWCGRPAQGLVGVLVHIDGEPVGFCSPGCASRWLIRLELRNNPLPVAYAPAPRPSTAIRGQSESALIRVWAREQGLAVAGKGYLAKELVAAYREAHP